MSKPTNFSVEESLEVIWEVIWQWEDKRDSSIDPDDVKLSMALITEAHEVNPYNEVK